MVIEVTTGFSSSESLVFLEESDEVLDVVELDRDEEDLESFCWKR